MAQNLKAPAKRDSMTSNTPRPQKFPAGPSMANNCRAGERIAPSKIVDLVSYAIRDIVAAAEEEVKKGKQIDWLNIGDPSAYDFAPPRRILEAAAEALLSGKYTGYAPSGGDPELRRVIAGVEGCGNNEVFVTSGLSEGIDMALRILLDAGDSVLFPNPTYPLYATKADVFGAESIYYECDEKWLPDIDRLRESIKASTKAIVVINPNNPTGAVYPYSVLKEIADLAAEFNLAIIADEVYDHVLFEGVEMHKLKDIAKDVPVFSGNSLSKNFLYPGARVGYMAIHNDDGRGFLNAFMKMCNQRLSINWELQRGAIAAYNGDYTFLKPSIEKLQRRSDILCGKIAEIPGLSVVAPKGALYTFVKVDGYESDGKHDNRPDWNFTYDLLRTEGVLVVPGSAFYKNHPEEIYFRTTLLPDEMTMDRVVGKLEKFMKARHQG
ncbi:aminotransferase class I/II-fold pyridoxal phosphate-dependent enzyme [Candidatus Micrarchaeota archaeon]|nr:aminotransferase class I/II-fold pyridoxal phosphate-dependent enzyme [Candidatus Micrarchaeota archaeon]